MLTVKIIFLCLFKWVKIFQKTIKINLLSGRMDRDTRYFNFNLIHHPGFELLQADALLQIYVQQSMSDSKLDPDWPMWYTLVKNNKP